MYIYILIIIISMINRKTIIHQTLLLLQAGVLHLLAEGFASRLQQELLLSLLL